MIPCPIFPRFRRARWAVGGSLLLTTLARFALALSKAPTAPDKIPDLRPPLEPLVPGFWEQHGALVLGVAAFVVAAALSAVWLFRRPKPVVVVPPEVAARQALETLRGRTEDPWLVAEVARLLRRYLVAAFCASPAEWTTDEVLAALGRRSDFSPELLAAVQALLRECEAREFAPIQPPPPPDLVARALDVVARCESFRSPPAVPPAPSAAR